MPLFSLSLTEGALGAECSRKRVACVAVPVRARQERRSEEDLIAHQDVICFKRLAPFVQRLQLSMKLNPLLLQRFESGDLLLQRRSHASLLARGLV